MNELFKVNGECHEIWQTDRSSVSISISAHNEGRYFGTVLRKFDDLESRTIELEVTKYADSWRMELWNSQFHSELYMNLTTDESTLVFPEGKIIITKSDSSLYATISTLHKSKYDPLCRVEIYPTDLEMIVTLDF